MKKSSIYIVLMLLFLACSKDDNNPSINTPPEPFNLIGIPSSTQNVALQPTLSWEAATDIDNDQVVYDVYVEDFTSGSISIVPGSPPQNPTKIIAQGIIDTTITLDKLPLSARMNWKVIARDNEGGATESEVFTFRTRPITTRENPINNAAAFGNRYGHSTAFFNDKFWLIGGFSGIESHKNDVWSSVDGKEWTLENPDAGFEPRMYASVAVFKNKIWVVGGLSNTGSLSDIWTSDDGVNWTQETETTPFSNRLQSALVVNNDKLFLIGGIELPFAPGAIGNEVWSSTDGTVWVLETDEAPYNARYGFETVVFNDQIFVIGGTRDDSTYYNEVWYTTNGNDWTQANNFNKFGIRANFNTTVFDNKIWIAGGINDGLSSSAIYNDLWYSLNGTDWRRQTTDAFYSYRFGSQMVSGNNRILLIAGNETPGDAISDVWMFD